MSDRSDVVVSGVGWLPCDRQAGVDPGGQPPWRQVRLFPDYPIDSEAPGKTEQRAMGQSMLAAVFAAGRALAGAGLKGDAERLAETQILSAGRCADRDDALDERVLAEAGDGGAAANRQLREGLRPSLFLAQLPNLISANIAIVHAVTGRSQTFIGEEAAGVEAIATALDRLTHRETVRCLAGGVFWPGRGRGFVEAMEGGPCASRPGYPLAAGAAYLVLEQSAAARARGHIPICRISGYRRAAPGASATAQQLLADVAGSTGLADVRIVVAGRGAEAERARECDLRNWLAPQVPPDRIVAFGEAYGACFEATAASAVALAVEELAASVRTVGERSARAAAVVLGSACDAVFMLEPIRHE